VLGIELQREGQGRVYGLRARGSPAKSFFGLRGSFPRPSSLSLALRHCRGFVGGVSRRSDRNFANSSKFERRRPQITGITLHVGDELEHVALRLAAEAVEDLAGHRISRVARAERRALVEREAPARPESVSVAFTRARPESVSVAFTRLSKLKPDITPRPFYIREKIRLARMLLQVSSVPYFMRETRG